MDKIVEEISKLSPFNPLFEYFGFGKNTSAILSTIMSLIVCYGIVYGVKKIHSWDRKVEKARDDLRPQVDFTMERSALQYYIQTYFQNASPTLEEEPAFTHKFVSRTKLIPFFIDTAFDEKKIDDRFYIVLGDSGMGKTTFMINLYFAYHRKWVRRKYKLKMYRFANTDTMDQIRAFSSDEARNTILLLDALDEDHKILSTDKSISDVEAFRIRVDEIINAVRNFREVIITCRTQYFPEQEADPYELRILRPDQRVYYILNKIYISPFTIHEINRYLSRKYGILPFINKRKKIKAKEIITKSPYLMVRPMLLSYIDYLLDGYNDQDSIYNIYWLLIVKWLYRESEKRKYIGERHEFIDKLRMVSQLIALRIYENWKKNGRLYLTKKETLEVAHTSGIELLPKEVTGQSLLTTDGLGNWRFAHKSIMEFFLAQKLLADITFLKEFSFSGMDMAEVFFHQNVIDFNFFHINSALQVFSEKNSSYVKSVYIQVSPAAIRLDGVVVLTTQESSKVSKERSNYNDFLESKFITDLARLINSINVSKGYGRAYDDNLILLGHFDDFTNKYNNNFKGFRLPFEFEWSILKQYYEDDIVLHSSVFETTNSISIANDFLNALKTNFPKFRRHYIHPDSLKFELVHAVNLELNFVDVNSGSLTKNLIINSENDVLYIRLVYVP